MSCFEVDFVIQVFLMQFFRQINFSKIYFSELVARLAQLVERGTFNPEAEGSSPSSGVIVVL